MFLRKCQADVMLIVQTPHKTFIIFFSNDLHIFPIQISKQRNKKEINRVRQHSEQLYIMWLKDY